jgi:hypothetical protein
MKICKFSLLGIGLGISLLAGCTPEVAKWSPPESPKENRVDRIVFAYTFPYPVNMKSMNSLEKARFLEFLKETIPSPYAVKITLEEYGGHSDKRIKDIERELLRFGVPLDAISRNFDSVDLPYTPSHKYKYGAKCHHTDHHKTHERGSAVVIVVERFVVITPSCANYLTQIGDASQAYNSSNFGCATEANLGMMISNPLDLLRGRERSPYDGTVMAAGVNRYETDNIKPIVAVSTTVMQQNQGASGSGSSGGGATGSASGGGY